MIVQVLVAAMHQTDHTLLGKMNINSDVIVGNQCKDNSIEKFKYKGYEAVYLNFDERGVGLNRNNALIRATGDVCLFADDDMVYVDNYVEKVQAAFDRYPDADVIVFNLIEKVPMRYVIRSAGRVNRINYLRYGTARVAVKLESIRNNAIYFNQCFGGGTAHSHGEDNLFLTACLDKGLKIYAVPEYIAELTEERDSTWNKGYDERYFKDQGCLYKSISRRWWKLLCLQDAVRHSRLYKRSWKKAYTLMIEK
jgi:glycosyltransferase involved in cell wall biosynthesis